MAGLFSKPKVPKPPPPPAPPPTPDMDTGKQRPLTRKRKASGRGQTIVTGDLVPPTSKKTALG
jgi:hypothetical protein